MPTTRKYLFFIFAVSLTACVPDMTDRADFYALCSQHVEEYLRPGDEVVAFEAAQKDIDFVFWKSQKNARITTLVKASGSMNDDRVNGHAQIRNCSFKMAGNSWVVE